MICTWTSSNHWNLSSNHILQSNTLCNQKVQQKRHIPPSIDHGRLVDYPAQGWKSPQPFLHVPKCPQHSWVTGYDASHQPHTGKPRPSSGGHKSQALATAAISIADFVLSRNGLNICGFIPPACTVSGVRPWCCQTVSGVIS